MSGEHFTSEYLEFRNSVVAGRRFVMEERAISFLDGVRKSISERVVKLPKGTIVYRAQLDCVQKDWNEDPVPLQCHGRKRMIPNRNLVSAGRANPDRKAVFYCAVNSEIAIKETRPWIGSYVSIATFRIKRELKIVDFFTAYGGIYQSIASAIRRKKMKGKEFDDHVWHKMGEAFCQPVSISDDPIEYLPTQILTEKIQSLGYDGLAYRSSTEPEYKGLEDAGANLALFDIGAVAMHGKGWVVKINKLELEIEDGPHY
jgi:hypothetical protein